MEPSEEEKKERLQKEEVLRRAREKFENYKKLRMSQQSDENLIASNNPDQQPASSSSLKPDTPNPIPQPLDIENQDPTHASAFLREELPVSDQSLSPDLFETEVRTCRVCHTEGTESQPLFMPCKCTGTIRFVHQECLITWLKHSNQQSCELCRTEYSFTPIYAENAPTHISFFDIAEGLIKHCLSACVWLLHFLMVAFVWCFAIPWLTAGLFYFYSDMDFYEIAKYQFPAIEAVSSPSANLVMWIVIESACGFGLFSITMFGFLSFLWFMNSVQIQAEDEQILNDQILNADNDDANNDVNNDDINDDNNQQGQDQNRLVNDIFGIGQDDADDDEDILGVTSVKKLVERLISFALFIGVALYLLVYIPRVVGFLFTSFTPVKVIVPRLALYELKFLHIATGWMLLILALLFLLGKKLNNAISQTIALFLIYLKVVTLLVIETGIVPLFVGILLMHYIRPMTTPLSEPLLNLLQHVPMVAFLLKWVIGFLFMVSFSSVIIWVKEHLRAGVLWFFRNPAEDPEFSRLKDYMENPLLSCIRRVVSTLFLYVMAILLLIWGPLSVLKYFGVTPIHLWPVEPEIYINLYELSFYLFCPLIIDYLAIPHVFKFLILNWVTTFGHLLGLQRYLFYSEDHPVEFASYFGLRITVMVLLGLISIFLLQLVMFAAPLLLGRLILSHLGLKLMDMYAVVTGLWVIFVAGKTVLKIYLMARQPNLSYETVKKTILDVNMFVVTVIQWLILIFINSIAIPLLIGLLFSLGITKSHIPPNETPIFSLATIWAFGITLYSSWVRFVQLGVIEDTRYHLKETWDQLTGGLLPNGEGDQPVQHRFHFATAMRHTFPLLIDIIASLCMPYTVIKTILPLMWTITPIVQDIAFRYVYTVFAVSLIVSLVYQKLLNWLVDFFQKIFEEKYQIGQTLNNHQTQADKNE